MFNVFIDSTIKNNGDCTCSDFVKDNGYGNCQKLLLGHPICYVNEPSNCTDLYADASAGRNFSWEACMISFGKCLENESHPLNSRKKVY